MQLTPRESHASAASCPGTDERQASAKAGGPTPKGHRDVIFDGSSNAPSSIILTTLAGRFCSGERTIMDALLSTLTSTLNAINAARPGRIMLWNPRNQTECLTDQWTEESYAAFVTFIRNFHGALIRLRQQLGQGYQVIMPEVEASF